uniref:Uncharacterized protein n=1 Tax=Escherichia coli TaxID=562 RepID=A0A2S1PR07_ECOLX|nr:hypothetical protein [Escherichia coli]
MADFGSTKQTVTFEEWHELLGVSLDIGNYCTLRLFFNQAQLLYSGSKCDKSGKYYICLVSCFATAAGSTSLSDAVPDQPA